MKQRTLFPGDSDGLETAWFTSVSKTMYISDGQNLHPFTMNLSRCGGQDTKLWMVMGLADAEGNEFRVISDDGYTALQVAYDLFYLGHTSWDVDHSTWSDRDTDGTIDSYRILVMDDPTPIFEFEDTAQAFFRMHDRYDMED